MADHASDFQRVFFRRLIAWIIFGAFGALIPLWMITQNREVAGIEGGWTRVVKDGELLLVASVLAVGAVGELLADALKGLSLSAIINVACAVALMLGSVRFYSRIDASKFVVATKEGPVFLGVAPQHVVGWSLVAFVVCIVIGGSTIWIKTVGERGSGEA